MESEHASIFQFLLETKYGLNGVIKRVKSYHPANGSDYTHTVTIDLRNFSLYYAFNAKLS